MAKRENGFTLIELLIAIAIIAILAAISISNLLNAQRKSQYSRAASDTKTATSQAIVFQNDRGVYPGAIAALRMGGYANVTDNDPWKTPYVVSDLFADTGLPPDPSHSELHVCSKGASTTAANCTSADLSATPVNIRDGGVGYSATYGSWTGS